MSMDQPESRPLQNWERELLQGVKIGQQRSRPIRQRGGAADAREAAKSKMWADPEKYFAQARQRVVTGVTPPPPPTPRRRIRDRIRGAGNTIVDTLEGALDAILDWE